MAEWRPVNIATITEEKVEGEEVGEDGMVETIDSPQEEEEDQPDGREGAHSRLPSQPSPSSADGEDETRPSLERPSSLVEKDVKDGEDNAKDISSILSSITFDNDRPSPAPARTTLPRTHPAAPRSTAPRSKTLPRSGSRASGFTMNLSEKFVTELSFYDPSGSAGPLVSPVILLGVFLATDQVIGDHSVYKVSPVSPLAALKIKPQDRLLKINGVSLEGWSHACVVDYVKSLTLSATTTATVNDAADTTTDIMLSMELRRTGRNVRSPQEAPPSRVLNASLRIRRKLSFLPAGATVTSVHEREICVRYRTTLPRRLKAAHKGLHLSTIVSGSGVASLVLQADDHGGAGRFLLHTFDASCNTSANSSPRIGSGGGGSNGGGTGVVGGEVVVVESDASRSWYLHASSRSCVALMYAASLEPQMLTVKDVRFFSLVPAPGDHLFRIQHLATGSFLSVASDCLGLVTREADGTLPDSTLLHVLPC